MQLIHENPYRIAGILSNATAREMQKQRGKIKAFASAKKVITSEFDFNILSKIDRAEEVIEKAFSNIEQNQDKVNNSLFWFVNANPFDNTAIDYLKNGNSEKAQEIWGKVTNEKDVNSSNFSAFNNIGTLKLLSNSKSEIKEGIEAKIKLIESEYFENFVHSVADQTFTIDNQKQSRLLVDELLTQFKNQHSSSDTLELFSNCGNSTQNYLSKKLTEEPLHNIESSIESAKKKRNANKGDSYKFGLKLFENTKDDLSLLKNLLSTNDLKYKMIADNLANEIMQCGIDYFNEWKGTKDPSKDGLTLLNCAKAIAISTQTKDRVKENLEGLKEWARTAPIQDDLNFITQKLDQFSKGVESCSKAKKLIIDCIPKLKNIRTTIGRKDELYLSVSCTVFNHSQGMAVATVNKAQEDNKDYNLSGMGNYILLKPVIEEALELSYLLEKLDKSPEIESHYNQNHSTLVSLAKQINISVISPQEKLSREIKTLTRKIDKSLNELNTYTTKNFIQTEIKNAKRRMDEIEGFHLFRFLETKDRQIRDQEKVLKKLYSKNSLIRKEKTKKLKEKIKKLQKKLQITKKEYNTISEL